jgi:hypothetical protein
MLEEISGSERNSTRARGLRRCDDNFRVDKFLVKGGILTLLIGRCHEGMSLVFEPLSNAKLVFGGTQEAWLVVGMVTTLFQNQRMLLKLGIR